MAANICYVALSRPWSRQHGKLGTRPYIVSVTEIDSARNSVTQIHASSIHNLHMSDPTVKQFSKHYVICYCDIDSVYKYAMIEHTLLWESLYIFENPIKAIKSVLYESTNSVHDVYVDGFAMDSSIIASMSTSIGVAGNVTAKAICLYKHYLENAPLESSSESVVTLAYITHSKRLFTNDDVICTD
jgi:hypothetical protein